MIELFKVSPPRLGSGRVGQIAEPRAHEEMLVVEFALHVALQPQTDVRQEDIEIPQAFLVGHPGVHRLVDLIHDLQEGVDERHDFVADAALRTRTALRSGDDLHGVTKQVLGDDHLATHLIQVLGTGRRQESGSRAHEFGAPLGNVGGAHE